MTSRDFTVDQIMEILTTTVPRLEELTHDVLGGNMLRIVRENHPAWKGMNPRTWQKQTDYFEWKFPPAFEAFRQQRAELLEVLEELPPEAWERTATVSVPPNQHYEYSTRYYGDWMARHERAHLGHMGRILKAVV